MSYNSDGDKMAVLPIHVLPDPVLKQRSKRIRYVDGAVQRLIGNMLQTMHSTNGVGLAAPQVGATLRVIVIGIPEEEDIILINPEIVRRTGERLVDEGCLSIPGYVGQIKRAESVTVKGRDQNGKEIKLGEEQYKNRLWQYVSENYKGVSSKVIKDELDYLCNRIDSLHELSCKGVHGDVNLFEVNQCVIYIYLLIGDILRIKKGKTS